MDPIDLNTKLQEIFFVNYSQKLKSLKSSKTKFVYYTTAETAYKIIKNKEIWMRSISTMNDSSEFDHGISTVKHAMESETGKQIIDVLDNIFDSKICSESYDIFVKNSSYIKDDISVTCFSEHSSKEDDLGRLSMWRAYGGKTGVALVFKSQPFLNLLDSHGISTSSVDYLNEELITEELNKVLESIKNNIQFIKQQNKQYIQTTLFNFFLYASACNKHPSFTEEKEWRLIYLSILKNDNMKITTEVIGGVPQIIHKLKLQKTNDANLNILDILDRIIIGPCEFAENTKTALGRILIETGDTKLQTKIINSKIPLRLKY